MRNENEDQKCKGPLRSKMSGKSPVAQARAGDLRGRCEVAIDARTGRGLGVAGARGRGRCGVIHSRVCGVRDVAVTAVGNLHVGRIALTGLIHSAVRHRHPRGHDDALQAVGNPLYETLRCR